MVILYNNLVYALSMLKFFAGALAITDIGKVDLAVGFGNLLVIFVISSARDLVDKAFDKDKAKAIKRIIYLIACMYGTLFILMGAVWVYVRQPYL